jgi:hypothetical protein
MPGVPMVVTQAAAPAAVDVSADPSTQMQAAGAL